MVYRLKGYITIYDPPRLRNKQFELDNAENKTNIQIQGSDINCKEGNVNLLTPENKLRVPPSTEVRGMPPAGGRRQEAGGRRQEVVTGGAGDMEVSKGAV